MTIFSKIIDRQIASYIIKEDDFFIAFLDVSPLVKGHVLVVPKIEVNKLFDLPQEYLGTMLNFAKPIASAIEKTFDCKRCGVSVIGLEVPHAHMHLVPINTADDLNFTREKLNCSEAEMLKVQLQILDELNN